MQLNKEGVLFVGPLNPISASVSAADSVLAYLDLLVRADEDLVCQPYL